VRYHQVIGERLGQGGYASVYKALNLKTGEFVAVKELLLADEDQSQPVAGALPNDQRTVIMVRSPTTPAIAIAQGSR